MQLISYDHHGSLISYVAHVKIFIILATCLAFWISSMTLAARMHPHESGDLGSQCVCDLARRNQVFLGCQDAIQNIATGLERIQIWLQSWGMINLCGEEVSQK